jgi:DNA-3-methyladenine glycosylase II
MLRFATPLTPGWIPTEVTLTQDANHLCVDWDSDIGSEAMQQHVQRLLSLDVDASGFANVIAADPVLGELIDPHHGIRPPLFWSPYEAAIWAVLSQRVRMSQGSKLKQRLATELGTTSSSGHTTATPSPAVLAELKHFDGINDIKLERLRAVANAALNGTLDPQRLRATSVSNALDELQTIDGIGPFSAELILVRGAGAPDVFPTNEKRLHTIMNTLYGTAATSADLTEIASRWSPYRSWIAFHLRSQATA